jgi:hypothetical protein
MCLADSEHSSRHVVATMTGTLITATDATHKTSNELSSLLSSTARKAVWIRPLGNWKGSVCAEADTQALEVWNVEPAHPLRTMNIQESVNHFTKAVVVGGFLALINAFMDRERQTTI